MKVEIAVSRSSFTVPDFWLHDPHINEFWLETIPKFASLIKIDLDEKEIDKRFQKTKEQITKTLQESHKEALAHKEDTLDREHKKQLKHLLFATKSSPTLVAD